MQRQRIVLGAVCVLLGLLGAAAGLLIWHLWQDHQLLHNMQAFLIEQASRAAKPSAPIK